VLWCMSKTLYGPGVIVTSQWLNGAREISFDGADADWHYAPVNKNDIQRGGNSGLDTVYVTLETDQSYGSVPVTGRKSFMGLVQFGDQTNTNGLSAPLFWNTNAKFNQGGTQQSFLIKYAQLDAADAVTKEVLNERINNFPVVDEGFF
jgi:hypothetical protein